MTGKGIFDVLSEIKSLPLHVQHTSHYICRGCIQTLKKRRSLLNQLANITTFFSKLHCGEQDSTKSLLKRSSVDVCVKVKWPSQDWERKLPEDLTSLGKMLVRGTFKQIAAAV